MRQSTRRPATLARTAALACAAGFTAALAGCDYTPDRSELEAKIAEAQVGEFGTCIEESYRAGVELQMARDRLKELQEGSPSDSDVTMGVAAADRAIQLRRTAEEACIREQRELADAERVAELERQLAALSARQAELEAAQAEMSREILIGVTFDTNSSILTQETRAVLDVQADRLVRRGTPVEIAGHASSTGTAVRNMELSEERAQAVRDYLVERGVKPELITAQGYGAREPIATNQTTGGRRANQRIELRFQN